MSGCSLAEATSRDVNGEGYWELDADITEGVGGLIARSDPSGRWWFGAGDDEGEDGKEDLWKRTGVGTGYTVSVFGGPRRERAREKENHHLPASITLDTQARIVRDVIFRWSSSFLVCG